MAQYPNRVTVDSTVDNNVNSSLYVNANTVIKGSPGKILRVNVLVAGSSTGTINDETLVANSGTANEIAVIPETVGEVTGVRDWSTKKGIVVNTGTGQVVSVLYV